MKTKKFLLNVLKVAASNVFTVLAGIVAGFVLPKIIGVTNYGYYKTFSLYICYITIFQFGIEEGIYLLFGGRKYESLDKEKFRYYTRFLAILETICTILLILVSLIFLEDEYRFIFVCVACFILVQNITTYFQYISQITGRFNELSIRNVIKAILTIVSVLGMWIYYHFHDKYFLSYKVYTVLYVLIFAILAIWYVFTYRDITFGKISKPDKDSPESIKNLIKIGLPLLISNLCSTLVFAIDRQFVSVLFDVDTYGAYAFAYNMLQLVTVATSSIATVIYPTLKQSNTENLVKKYKNVVMVFNIFVFLCIAIYFPLDWFIKLFFANQTKYIESLPIFRIILPSLVVSCTITVIIHNYFKTFGYNAEYFFIVLGVLVFAIGANFAAYFIWKSTEAISWASVLTTLIWYFIASIILSLKQKTKWIINSLYMLLCMIAFYLITAFITQWWLGLIIYLVAFILMSFIFNFKIIYKKFQKGEK